VSMIVGTVLHMRLDASPEAVRLVQEQGGKLYVWAKRSRCCGGPLVFLETSAEPGERRFRHVPTDRFELYLEESLGVPEELKQAIFEPFRQGPRRTPHSPGVGIGLSLVARFAELHGGRAWVEDRGGGGASFRVFLPTVSSQEAAAAASEALQA